MPGGWLIWVNSPASKPVQLPVGRSNPPIAGSSFDEAPVPPCRGFYLGSLRDRRRPTTADQRKEGRNMGKLDGKAAIVTDAARGLGRAYARRLAGLGAKVAVADLN